MIKGYKLFEKKERPKIALYPLVFLMNIHVWLHSLANSADACAKKSIVQWYDDVLALRDKSKMMAR